MASMKYDFNIWTYSQTTSFKYNNLITPSLLHKETTSPQALANLLANSLQFVESMGNCLVIQDRKEIKIMRVDGSKTLLPQLDHMTEEQVVDICNLQQSSQQAEEALSQGLDQLHQSLAPWPADL
ncbi:hypothetical protein PR202_gb00505 [Eleusine coracana subsp. coracana]|uniref:Uncharacterized protein n=1 Tax=Eleusine coracana subsp. coracana TaxID=191504 RepID=A0AAV5DTX4_ELECO|nr:hypothetical protein PR202_gb00505 [Eleusine coracana subsp. coracana]